MLSDADGGGPRIIPINGAGKLGLPDSYLWGKNDGCTIPVGMRNACHAEKQYAGMVDIIVGEGVSGVHIPNMVIIKIEVYPFPPAVQENGSMYLRYEKRVASAISVLIAIGDGAGKHAVIRAEFQGSVGECEEPVARCIVDAYYRYPVPISRTLPVLMDSFLIIIRLLKFIAQACREVEFSQWQAVVEEAGEHGLPDAVVGVGGEAVL